MPLVSVLMPAHNSGAFISAAVDSILGQTFKDFELLVLDDASSDQTVELLDGYKDVRVSLHVSESRLGIARSRNRLVKLASAPLLAWMDADDVSLDNRLNSQVDFLSHHPRVAVVGADLCPTDAALRLTGRPWTPPLQAAAIKWQLMFGTPLFNGTTMARGEIYERVGPYDENLPVGEDNDFWARCAPDVVMANLPRVLLLYRKHAGNTTASESQSSVEVGAEISRRALATLLGKEVSLSVARILRHAGEGLRGSSGSEIEAALHLLKEAESVFDSRGTLSRREQSEIAGLRALQRLRLLRAGQQAGGSNRRSVSFKASPRLVLDAANHVARRHMRSVRERLALQSSENRRLTG